MSGRGKGGKGLGAHRTKTVTKKTGKKTTKKISKTTKFNKKQELARAIEKEYTERMALPASEDKTWYGPSREEVEDALEAEYGGEYRYKEASKHCRSCFGYGMTLGGDGCTNCISYPSGIPRPYLGDDVFKRIED